MRHGWPGGRGGGRHARRTHTLVGSAIALLGAALAVTCAIAVISPTTGAVQVASRMANTAGTVPLRAPGAAPILTGGEPFDGTPAVGALFTLSGGQLARHFCTASVVDSPHGDLVITAAHCVTGKSPGQIAFVPGYHSGVAPFGIWLTSAVLADSAWRTSADPDHDVAFLVVHQAGRRTPVQNLTGGEQLGIGWPTQAWVQVIGYPDATEQPIACQNESKPLGRHQMEFDCGGYTNGTSGGPFLGRVNPSTGAGTVIGVIGGYEQGGDIASVSYSPWFGGAVQALYENAVAQG
jgi:V8-like Glu-specific endopeptidase